ncbi:coenzyme F420-0:L-glutamate ligase [Streptomyces sp. ODS28]|uniref:coenzyme F420-0:L-glutamate ligase n=1 Tax=Streptomyces sp. ODS28 TaxID=3136688 RepID=UPI0031ECFFD5
MNAPATDAVSLFALQPFPTIEPGDDLAAALTGALSASGTRLHDGDVLIVASKPVSIAEGRYVDLATITPSAQALELSARTGKPAELVELILQESHSHVLATESGPIIARHRLGLELTSAGVDRAGPEGAWLLPADPDASARALREAVTQHTGAAPAVVIADSDGRGDRRGATVISIGAAGVAPLRISEHAEPDGRLKRQGETLTDMIAAAAGLILGQRGRGAPVVVLRGLAYPAGDKGVRSMLHHR